MSDNSSDINKVFSIIFRGDIVIGHSLPEVKQNLQKLFNVNDEEINRLFMGKPVALRKGLQLKEAQRYKDILKQEGVIVSIKEEINPDVNAKTGKAKVEKETAAQPKQEVGLSSKFKSDENKKEEWQLFPVGSQLSDAKEQDKKVDIQTDHLQVLPQEGNLIKDSERVAVAVSSIDVEDLNWSLTPYGEQLLKDDERISIRSPEIDISSLSLAEQEGNLLKDSERMQVEPVTIDTSHIQLADDKTNKD
jgi:hypothetical protein